MRTSTLTRVIVLFLCIAGSCGPGNTSGLRAHATPQLASSQFCPPLPAPSGAVVQVATVNELVQVVNNAAPGVTILIADGTYNLDGAYLRIAAPGVTLRSAGGSRESVILDGNYQTTEIIQIVASDVTVADLTLREAFNHPIHVMSSENGHTLNTLIYNVHILDPGEQAVKINPAAAGFYVDYGEIACSRIELTDSGRPHIRNDCYTGGIDGHQARGWTIRDNRIEGFWCAQGLSEHAVHFWTGSRDTLVDRNTLVDNARGVGFGLQESGSGRTYADTPCPAAVGYVGHYGGVIRNNFIHAGRADLFASSAGFDCGVCLWQACEVGVFHNTVTSFQPPFSSIEWRFSNTTAEIANNLVTHNLRAREDASANLAGNLTDAPLSLFVSLDNADLHLVPSAGAALDQGAALPAGASDADIDGDPRPVGAGRDIGADEYLEIERSFRLFLPFLGS